MSQAPGMDRVRFVSRISCPLHGAGAGAAPVGLQPWKSVHVDRAQQPFRLLKCPSCGVALTDPYPSEDTVAWLYEGRNSEDNYDPIRGSLIDRLKDFFARRDIRRIRDRAARPTFKSILDLGTGNGRFALACRDVFPGSRVDATDLQTDPPPALRAASGIRYVPLGIMQGESCRYELIILRHVLEHLHDPLALLSTLAQRLTPEGVLYIEVPNYDSAQTRLFSSSANAFFLPYHLFHFNKSSLEKFLGTAGLDCRISTITLPITGCILAALLKQKRSWVHQSLGIALHPLQVLLDLIFGKSVLAAVCTRVRFQHP